MPRSSWRSKLMARTSVTVPFEPTGVAKLQGDLPKSVRSTNPQYQCGFRAIRDETKHRSRDALHRPPSWAYSIENTGITGERSPFRQVPRVTPSALQSDSAMRASASRAAADIGWEAAPDVSRTEVHVEEAQKVTPWKNYLAETKPPTGFFARQPVTPCHGENFPPTNACFWPNGSCFVLPEWGAKSEIAWGSFGNLSAAFASRRSDEFSRESVNEHVAGTIDRVLARA